MSMNPYEPPPVNHALHIVLALLTGGLWLIPYAIILIDHGSRVKAARRYDAVLQARKKRES